MHIHTETRTVQQLFTSVEKDFLIPDYQRAYSRTENECQTLWNDFCDFALPDDDIKAFNDERDEYFLGVIVTFRNGDGRDEVIDGQQRLTTLLLLMRAFYQALGGDSGKTFRLIDNLGECIWKTTPLGELDKSSLKITSEILQKIGNEDLRKILSTGTTAKVDKSNCAVNYRFFQAAIANLQKIYRGDVQYLAARILKNCFITHLRAESQDMALQMFSTLNDRGLALSAVDIFKAVMYKFYRSKDLQACDEFIENRQILERRAAKTFGRSHGLAVNPTEFLFLCYSYKEVGRAFKKIRRVYEVDNYAVLRRTKTLADLFELLDFFDDLLKQNALRFSPKSVRYAHILFRAKNVSIWLILAHYFLSERDELNRLDEQNFAEFPERFLAFLLAHSITNPATQSMRGYIFSTLANLKKPVAAGLKSYTFSADAIRSEMNYFGVKGQKNLMMSLVLNWWLLRDEAQEIPPIEQKFDVEYIFPKSLAGGFESFSNKNSLNLLGNLALLEHGKNVNAAGHRFADKRKVYLGYEKNGKFQKGTVNRELQQLAQTHGDFTEIDINLGNQHMVDEILAFVAKHNFLQS
ncbi:MAG: DUF262 domain-containing protein [Selenomonadaceae bacterium]|nr:DUF262 domain-containing protein [Selenomonadaceae bacterium]